MGRNERLVVHLVDVIAGENEDRVGGVVLDDVDVLEHGVGRPAVPLGDAAAGDVRLKELHAALVSVEIPGPAKPDVVIERAGVVLRQDHDIVDVGVDAIRQGEVDDPVFATERNSGLCAHARQDRQALTLTAGEDHGHRPFHAGMLAPDLCWAHHLTVLRSLHCRAA